MTTKAWNLCVKWKYGSSNWISLKNIKDYYPVKLADYSINNNIKDKTDLSLWVPYVINKRYAIPAKGKSKYWKITHKYGTKIIKYVNEAYKINADNRNYYWHNSIYKEMDKVIASFNWIKASSGNF